MKNSTRVWRNIFNNAWCGAQGGILEYNITELGGGGGEGCPQGNFALGPQKALGSLEHMHIVCTPVC